jgi:hypothetical protein
MKYSNGALPHEKLLASIELYGTQAVPQVQAELANVMGGGRDVSE